MAGHGPEFSQSQAQRESFHLKNDFTPRWPLAAIWPPCTVGFMQMKRWFTTTFLVQSCSQRKIKFFAWRSAVTSPSYRMNLTEFPNLNISKSFKVLGPCRQLPRTNSRHCQTRRYNCCSFILIQMIQFEQLFQRNLETCFALLKYSLQISTFDLELFFIQVGADHSAVSLHANWTAILQELSIFRRLFVYHPPPPPNEHKEHIAPDFTNSNQARRCQCSDDVTLT